MRYSFCLSVAAFFLHFHSDAGLKAYDFSAAIIPTPFTQTGRAFVAGPFPLYAVIALRMG